MRSARQQAHAAELAQVPGGSARDETLAVARHVVAAEVALPALATDWNSHASIGTWRTATTEALAPACFRVTLERSVASERMA